MDVDDGMGVIVAAYLLSCCTRDREVSFYHEYLRQGRPKSFVKEGEDAQWRDEWMNPQIPIPMDEIPFDVALLLHHCARAAIVASGLNSSIFRVSGHIHGGCEATPKMSLHSCVKS